MSKLVRCQKNKNNSNYRSFGRASVPTYLTFYSLAGSWNEFECQVLFVRDLVR